MGAWGTGILSNDLAADVAGEYRALIEDGKSGDEATAEILRGYGDTANDPDERTAFWTGLAYTQYRLGRLEPDVRDRALEVIDSGGDANLFFSERNAKKRLAALQKLRSQLVGPQRGEVRIRKPKPIASPVQAGDVFSFRLSDGRVARLRTLAVDEERQFITPLVEMIDEQGRAFRLPGLERRDRRPRPARWWAVTGRRKELPAEGELEIIGHDASAIEELGLDRVKSGLFSVWPHIREDCARLLDDPDARPPHEPLF